MGAVPLEQRADSGGRDCDQLLLGHTEHTFDASGIANGNLDVSLCLKTCRFVDGSALNEDATDRIDRRHASLFQNRVQASHDGAVEVSAQAVAGIRGQCEPCGLSNSHKALVGSGDEFNVGCCGEVQAPAQFDHGANDERLLDVPPAWLSGKFQAAQGIGLPKVDTRPKPVVIVIAGLEGFAAQEALAHFAVTAVIPQNKPRGQSVHVQPSDT